MTQTKEKFQNTNTKRLIGQIEGKRKGPTVIFFGGIHGNEMAGVKALELVFEELRKPTFEMYGAIFGIRGNIPAQLKNRRFLDQDLNRLWTTTQIAKIMAKPKLELSSEENELSEIYELLLELLETKSPPFYFIDFHTTSSKSLPFITINDAMINRKFSRLFPVPTILGIEEYLEGPLLSHMNEKGYVALGFESGQHVERQAVTNSIAFTWLCLVFAGFIEKKDVLDYYTYYQQLLTAAEGNVHFYEVIYRQPLLALDDFKMNQGFQNFQEIEKGTLLAVLNDQTIKAEKNTILFMPLYQEQGEEGFFLIRRTPKSALWLSAFLRKIKFDSFLVLLPGISWSNDKKESLLVNVSVARYYAKSIFHLLGYRNRSVDKNAILMQNRERTAKTKMYKRERWYKNELP
ncbi:MAG: succinylglutamate desuccinylase/aspartoacylase family protein [Flavobacteriaceae bacterium]